MNANVDFMRQLEEDYRLASGLESRRHYKIFYGQVFPAPILTLGLNPGGDPEGTSDDGTRQKDGSLASASASFFEGMENDVLDCEWRENTGLRRLLLPLVGQDRDRFRRQVVKTNIAFRRSRRADDIDLTAAQLEAVPFVDRILAHVSPRLVVLTGVGIDLFLNLYALDSRRLTEIIKAPRVNQVAFAAAAGRLRATGCEAVVIQVAHASQFAWTYERYGVCAEIAGLIGDPPGLGASVEHGMRSLAGPLATAQPNNLLNQRSTRTHMTPTTRIGSPRLAELEAKWKKLGIVPQFPQVHHFASNKFSTKPPPV
jgi:hypothetical protein